jgi:glycosyltransferase involved in cell wall biosynthesis
VRIAHILTLISGDGAFGGPVTVAYEQAEALAKRGHTVTLIAGWDGVTPAPKIAGVRVRLFRVRRAIPVTRFGGLVAPGLMRHLIRNRDKYQIAHVHLARDLITLGAAQIATATGVPYAVQTHGMIGPDRRVMARSMDAVLTRRMLRRAGRVFALTPHEERSLTQVNMADGLQLQRLGNGIAYEKHTGANTSEGNEVLFCARLHPRKRVLTFVDMAEELVQRNVGAKFAIVGPDEGDLARLRSRIMNGHSHYVSYEGALSPAAVRMKMSKAAVYVLPSVNEPFPMTVLEAMAAGTPVVLTASCGIAPVLATEGAAMVTDGTPRQLADAVEAILADRALRRAMITRAYAVLEQQFSVGSVAAALERAYVDVLASYGA